MAGTLFTDPTSASAAQLADAIREKQISSAEVVDAHLRRIDAVNLRLNAVVALAADRARDEARAADAALARGDVRGPLHGVPITIKDNLDTAGVVTTGGTLGRSVSCRRTTPRRSRACAPPAPCCWARRTRQK